MGDDDEVKKATGTDLIHLANMMNIRNSIVLYFTDDPNSGPAALISKLDKLYLAGDMQGYNSEIKKILEQVQGLPIYELSSEPNEIVSTIRKFPKNQTIHDMVDWEVKNLTNGFYSIDVGPKGSSNYPEIVVYWENSKPAQGVFFSSACYTDQNFGKVLGDLKLSEERDADGKWRFYDIGGFAKKEITFIEFYKKVLADPRMEKAILNKDLYDKFSKDAVGSIATGIKKLTT